MKATRTTSNFTKRDAINARNGIPLKNVDQMVFPIEKLAIGTDKMEDGDEREVSVLVSTDGDVFTTISPTVIAMVDEAINNHILIAELWQYIKYIQKLIAVIIQIVNTIRIIPDNSEILSGRL